MHEDRDVTKAEWRARALKAEDKLRLVGRAILVAYVALWVFVFRDELISLLSKLPGQVEAANG